MRNQTMIDLAGRFDELARRDASLTVHANTVGGKTAYQLKSNNWNRAAEQTFSRLALEALAALNLPTPGGIGALDGWLAHLFDVATDEQVFCHGPVWNGDTDERIGSLDCRHIDNVAEASAAAVRRAIEAQAAAGGDKTESAPAGKTAGPKEQLSLDARAVAVLSDNPHFTKLAQVARVLGVTHQALAEKKCPLFRRLFTTMKAAAPPPRGFVDNDGGIESSSDGKAKPSHRERGNRLPE